MSEQMDAIREMIQKKITDKKVRTIWFLCTTIDGRIMYGVSGNNNTFFAVAAIDQTGNVTIIR